jgi:hypothetical protein
MRLQLQLVAASCCRGCASICIRFLCALFLLLPLLLLLLLQGPRGQGLCCPRLDMLLQLLQQPPTLQLLGCVTG